MRTAERDRQPLSLHSPLKWAAGGRGLSAARFNQANAAYQRVGYHLRAVDGFSLAGGARYSGIWEPATGRAPRLHLGMTAAGVRDKLKALGSESFAMVDVSGFAWNGQSRFAT